MNLEFALLSMAGFCLLTLLMALLISKDDKEISKIDKKIDEDYLNTEEQPETIEPQEFFFQLRERDESIEKMLETMSAQTLLRLILKAIEEQHDRTDEVY